MITDMLPIIFLLKLSSKTHLNALAIVFLEYFLTPKKWMLHCSILLADFLPLSKPGKNQGASSPLLDF